jgi:WD40 repeat protein
MTRRSPILLALSLTCLSVASAAETPIEAITATPSVFVRMRHGFNQVAISPDGKFIILQEADSNKHELLVFDAATKKILHRLPRACGYSVAFTPDGARLVTIQLRGGKWNLPRDAAIHHDVNVFDVKSGKLLHTIPQEGTFTKYLGDSPGYLPYALADGVLVVRRTEGARVFDLKTGKSLGDLAAGKRLQLASISRDGRWLLTLDGHRNLGVWDVKKRKLERDLPRPTSRVEAACISPDGKWCASTTERGRTSIHDRATGRLKTSTLVTILESHQRNGYRATLHAAFTGDGKRLVVSVHPEHRWLPGRHRDSESILDGNEIDQGLRFWDWQSDKPVRRVMTPWHDKARKAWLAMGRFESLLMSEDGTRFLSSGNGAGVLLLDLKKPKPPPDWEPDEEPEPKPKKDPPKKP